PADAALRMRGHRENHVGAEAFSQACPERAAHRDHRPGKARGGEALEATPTLQTRTRADDHGGLPGAERLTLELEQRAVDARCVQLGVRDSDPADALEGCGAEPRGDAPAQAHRLAHDRRPAAAGAAARRVRIFAGVTPAATSSATRDSGRSNVATITAAIDSSQSSV